MTKSWTGMMVTARQNSKLYHGLHRGSRKLSDWQEQNYPWLYLQELTECLVWSWLVLK